MPTHVFVDESKANGLVVAAASCVDNRVNGCRKALRALLLPGQQRLHFNHERSSRRRQIINVIKDLELRVCLYQTTTDDAVSRGACLEAIVRDFAGIASRLVVERDESTLAFDNRALTNAIWKHDCHGSLRYELLAPKLDAMLWVPDAVAWCWVRGGRWRDLVAPLCEERRL